MTNSHPELDIRWPIGLLFTGIGVAVGLYGLFSGNFVTLKAWRVNVDSWWGLVMLLFGLAMIWGGARAGRPKSGQP